MSITLKELNPNLYEKIKNYNRLFVTVDNNPYTIDILTNIDYKNNKKVKTLEWIFIGTYYNNDIHIILYHRLKDNKFKLDYYINKYAVYLTKYYNLIDDKLVE